MSGAAERARATEDPRAVDDARRAGPVPLRARIALLWNRVLTSPRFQRFAAAFPLTRPIALKRTSDVFDLCAGFVYTQTVFACLDLGVLEMLDGRALEEGEITARIPVPPDAGRGLLEAATSIHLLRKLGTGHYVLGRHGASIVGNRELASVIRHNRILYRDLGEPVPVLRGVETELARYWPYAAAVTPSALSGDDVAPYSTFMAASQPLIAEEVLSHDPFGGAGRILDVGGGEGAFLEAVGRAYPESELVLFDLPAVVERARTRFRRLGWDARATGHGGDFLQDELPDVRPDVVTLVRVLHDLDDPEALALLTKIRGSLRDGGTLLIAEPMSDVRGAPRVGDAYFFWYLRALGRGRARSPVEISELARRAGFARTSPPVSRNPVIAVSLRAIV